MPKQPDFNSVFWEYFKKRPKKVRYEVRQAPNMLHDLVFLNSLIHDARLFRKKIRLRGRRLTIPLERDCWELSRGESPCLKTAESRLSIGGVIEVSWQFDGIDEPEKPDELWIDGICFSKEHRSHVVDHFELFIMGCEPWHLRIGVSQDDFTLRLTDTSEPR